MRKDTAHVQRGTPLTAREEQCLALFAQGYSRAEISQRLSVSLCVVSWALDKARIRLGAHTKVEAAIKYHDRRKEQRVIVQPKPALSWSGTIPDYSWSTAEHARLFGKKR